MAAIPRPFTIFGVSGSSGGGSGIVYSPVPASSSASGTAGQIAKDESYFYICTATNTWARTPISDWA